MAGTMTPERAALKVRAQKMADCGLSGAEIARRLNIRDRQVRRWVGRNNGHNPPSIKTANMSDKHSVHYSSATGEGQIL